MSIWKKIKNELIDIVEWTDNTSDTLVYRFERHGNEIKMGAKLTVRESQAAVFVNEGKLADVFLPGLYTLETQNMPVLSTLKGWKYGFRSPFKAEVYFVSMRNFTDQKWGTKNPVMLRDAEFGPIRLRGFGTYSLRVQDPAKFITEVAGTNQSFTTDGITEQLRNLIITRFTDAVAESKIPALDLAANYNELSTFVKEKINPEFNELGLEVSKFLVENISLPSEVEAMLDKRSSMGILGNLNSFSQFQAAQSMEKAAENPGGMAGAGVGMGMGFAMANQMGNMMNQPQQGQTNLGGPPPIPAAVQYFMATNGQQTGPFDAPAIKQMIQQGTLKQETLVWKQGMAEWIAASTVPEIKDLFQQSPPPIPS
ncbi:MAG: SPFH domain-containing protein [Bacteroidetes bacterium]|nr:SPFH domain-containing protein [Bacteroidota bacterium]HET6243929.1 SPFH domain-containing protein [Bacteroidia bacterium]